MYCRKRLINGANWFSTHLIILLWSSTPAKQNQVYIYMYVYFSAVNHWLHTLLYRIAYKTILEGLQTWVGIRRFTCFKSVAVIFFTDESDELASSLRQSSLVSRLHAILSRKVLYTEQPCLTCLEQGSKTWQTYFIHTLQHLTCAYLLKVQRHPW